MRDIVCECRRYDYFRGQPHHPAEHELAEMDELEQQAKAKAQEIVPDARQTAIFAEVMNGKGHVMIEAVAGSGKTWTILQAMKLCPPGVGVLVTSFGKAIVDELEAKVPTGQGIYVATLHALGKRACYQRFQSRTDDEHQKVWEILNKILASKLDPVTQQLVGQIPAQVERAEFDDSGDDEDGRRKSSRVMARLGGFGKKKKAIDWEKEWRSSLKKTVGLAKDYLAHTGDQIDFVMDLHQICPPEDDAQRGVFINQVLEALEACAANEKRIDFNDMIWFPNVKNLYVPQYEIIFVDEVQDLNYAQIAMLLKALKPGGRIIAVGDPNQGIYHFRGAAHDAFENVRERLNAKVMPLSVSYRCSKTVVREAQEIVPHIEARPGAEDGSVQQATIEDLYKNVREGDYIISRTNAPLLPICLTLLKNGQAASIKGRDIGGKLKSTIGRAKTHDLDAMLDYVDQWSKKEIERLEKRDRSTVGIEDTRDCIRALAEGEKSVADVLYKIDKLFTEEADKIIISSTHQAKGLESERVWLLRDTYVKEPRPGTSPQDIQEERNLLYVAITRAKKHLFMVNKPRQARSKFGFD
jgi:superfamily I DNA/RNA helicase